VTEHKDYSGTPLARKLGIKEEHDVAFVDAPQGFDSLVAPLPTGVRVKKQARGPLDVIVLFTTEARSLPAYVKKLASQLDKAGGLWVAYPKKSSSIDTDVTFENAQEAGLRLGLVDNKSCAIDDDWTALRFVYRLRDR
jgi:hypothetical protein